MELFLKYSGIVGIILMWLFVVFPAFVKKTYVNKKPFSYLGKDGKYAVVFNFVLVIIMILQLIFVLYIGLSFGKISLVGMIIFLSGTLLGILTGVINLKDSVTIHTNLGFGYFILSSIGALIISVSFAEKSAIVSFFSVFDVLLLGVGGLVIYLTTKKIVFAEMWMFVFSTIWVCLCLFLPV